MHNGIGKDQQKLKLELGEIIEVWGGGVRLDKNKWGIPMDIFSLRTQKA